MVLLLHTSWAQKDSTKFVTRVKTQGDTTLSTRQDAIYQRPTLLLNKTQTAIGGYLEGDATYQLTDKAAEYTMQFRRVNLFLYSTIARKIKFLSEIEFEPGEMLVNVETALMDFELNPALNFRAGILLPPIGAYNVRHDAPLWEFVERPLVATEIIPSTLTDVGAGFHGKLYGHNKVFAYDVYMVNGLQDGVVNNTDGRTFLQSGKTPTVFARDNNNTPSIVAKTSFRHRKIAEIGVSFYHGQYNRNKKEGLTIAPVRSLSILAIDMNTTIAKKAAINAEWAMNFIQVPQNLGNFYGSRQQGAYIECVYPVLRRKMLTYENATLNANLRLEAVDYNMGKFDATGDKIYDEVKAVVAGVSFRPSSGAVLKANYRWHWTRDALGNAPFLQGMFQVGIASYF